MDERGHLTTELRNPDSMQLDRVTTQQAFDIFKKEDAKIAAAVAAAKDAICRAIDLVAAALGSGGRLIYVGAGTSGRFGVLDAAECPPTFLTDPELVQGIIAGGTAALTRSVEGAEDDPEAGAAAVQERSVGPSDVVFGIATGGTTPFVCGALDYARSRGAKTIFLACVPENQVSDEADVSIRIVTGAEILTGSTRLKAGTATKMVLNMVTTIAMAKIGKVYENLMVDVNTRANAKLVDRGIRIIQMLTGLSRSASTDLLEAAHGHVKTALVMACGEVSRAEAERLIDRAGGRIGKVLGESGRDRLSAIRNQGCPDA